MKLTWFIKIIHHQSNPSFWSRIFRSVSGKSKLENERNNETHREKESNLLLCHTHQKIHTTHIFINYADLSWPNEILIGIFIPWICTMQKNTQVCKIYWNDGTFTWTFFLCILYGYSCGSTPHTAFIPICVSPCCVWFKFFTLLEYRYARCIFFSFRLTLVASIVILLGTKVPICTRRTQFIKCV